MQGWLVFVWMIACYATELLAAEPLQRWQVGDYEVQLQKANEDASDDPDCISVASKGRSPEYLS